MLCHHVRLSYVQRKSTPSRKACSEHQSIVFRLCTSVATSMTQSMEHLTQLSTFRWITCQGAQSSTQWQPKPKSNDKAPQTGKKQLAMTQQL